ncbi:DUF4292 domain-containing protein [Dyadobacter tibetensis]|uniref:DUF4292 domain-containing protein n=1 Tax=Dyadobacter tibetensis TaxID=1211851 RepID=UPI000472C345|nr:DUF4292 domain-containing protein [Dyadobacter tibetensis]
MNNNISLWLLALCMIGLSSCHRQRNNKKLSHLSTDSTQVLRPSDSTAKAGVSLAESSLQIEEVEFRYLTTKSKFSFKSRKQDLENVTVNLRVSKDSLIWMSVSGVGLEVARGLMSQDSIFFLDKLHKEYFKVSYAQLSEQYQFQLNFSLLQSILVGDLPFPLDTAARVRTEADFYVLTQAVNRIFSENFIAMSNRKLTRLLAVENKSENTFSVRYQDFKEVGTDLFPYESVLQLDARSPKDGQFYQTQIGIKHLRVEMPSESPGFPFSIPASYKAKR